MYVLTFWRLSQLKNEEKIEVGTWTLKKECVDHCLSLDFFYHIGNLVAYMEMTKNALQDIDAAPAAAWM